MATQALSEGSSAERLTERWHRRVSKEVVWKESAYKYPYKRRRRLFCIKTVYNENLSSARNHSYSKWLQKKKKAMYFHTLLQTDLASHNESTWLGCRFLIISFISNLARVARSLLATSRGAGDGGDLPGDIAGIVSEVMSSHCNTTAAL